MSNLFDYTVYIMILLDTGAKSIIEISKELHLYSIELKKVLEEMELNNLIAKDDKYNLTFEGQKIVQQIKLFY